MHRHLLAVVIVLSAFSVSATELEPRTIGPTAGNVSFVSSAFSGGKFLTVWRQLFMPTTGIWGAFSDAAGNPLGPSFAIIPSTNAQYLNLFPNGDGFVLVWDDANNSSQLCQIDGNGKVTAQTTIGPPGLIRAYAMPGRIVFSRSTGSTIVDFQGRLIRELSEHSFIAAGRNSFFGVTSTSDLMLTRYSGDGQSLQQWLLKPDFCRTLSGCWFVAAVRELDSGSVLAVVANNDRRLETLILAPDGAVSAPGAITTTLPVLSRASVQQSGTHLWLFLAGPQDGGATRIEATELDNKGIAIAPVMTVFDALPGMTELLVFAEGAGLVFAATSPTTAGQQVQTFVFRTLFAPVGPEVISTTASIQADAQIASNGASFLAVWKDTDGTRGSRWHWTEVDAAGRPSGHVLEGDDAVARKSLVSNGLDYLVLLVSSNRLIARRLASDGSILGDTLLFDSFVNLAGAAAVATSNGYVIVWSADYTMYSATLTSTGVAGPVRVIAPSVPSLPGRNLRFWESPVLAWDGSAILLTAVYEQDIIFAQTGADATQTPYAMLLTSDGALLAGSETPLDPAFLNPSEAASSGREFLVVGSEIALVNRVGTQLGVTYPIRNSLNGDVVWNGSAYVVARLVQGAAMVTLVARDGSILGTTFRRGPEDLDVATDAAGHLVISGVESDGRGPLRAVVYSGSELQPLLIGRSRAAAH